MQRYNTGMNLEHAHPATKYQFGEIIEHPSHRKRSLRFDLGIRPEDINRSSEICPVDHKPLILVFIPRKIVLADYIATCNSYPFCVCPDCSYKVSADRKVEADFFRGCSEVFSRFELKTSQEYLRNLADSIMGKPNRGFNRYPQTKN